MLLKNPSFFNKKGIISNLLLPFSYIYRVVSKIHTSKSFKANIPIICIGNLNLGGAGKTPIAIAVGGILNHMGIDFCYISRGYGRVNREAVFLAKNERGLDCKRCGDEPLLLNRVGDVFITSDKVSGIKEIQNKYRLIVTDDGLQNKSFKKNLNIVVVDGRVGFGNGRVFPAGPLRCRVEDCLRDIDIVIFIGDDMHNIKSQFEGKIIITAEVREVIEDRKIKQDKYLAFAGIAYPEKFFSTLEKNNFKVIRTKEYPDHYIYTDKDMDLILKEAADLNVITTEKDWVRIPNKYQNQIRQLPIKINFVEEDKNLMIELINNLYDKRES